MQHLSPYFEGLNTEAKTRYKQKVSCIGGLELFVSGGRVGESTNAVDNIHTWCYKQVSLHLSNSRHIKDYKLTINSCVVGLKMCMHKSYVEST